MKQLHISKHLSLPIDFATKTVAILAQRRKGKTYTASVIAEEMVAVKQPFVALDPTGAWWGLRASADGKSDGLPVVILGGQHGDVPLERTGGRLVADLVVDEPGYYVIDFSLFESGAAERQFATEFAERLYRAKGQVGKDFPLHLFVDEADRFVPQQLRKGNQETNAALLGAFEAIVRRGGLRGLGTTLISQRAAVVNKNVLEMLDILIALRTLGPNDRKAIDGYIQAHGTDEQREALMGSIGSLDIGEAWIWEPGAEPSLFERVRIRERHTFNSSATPKAGERRVEPRRLAPVDLKVLGDRMAATIEKAKATDPKELNKTINDLRGQIRKLESAKPTAAPLPKTEVKTIEKRIMAVQAINRLEALLDKAATIPVIVEEIRAAIREGKELNAANMITAPVAKPAPTLRERQTQGYVPSAPHRQVAAQLDRVTNGDAPSITGGALRILKVLASKPELQLTKPQLGTLSRMKHTGGSFGTYMSRLRSAGLITDQGQYVSITDAGIDFIGADRLPEPQTSEEVLQQWLNTPAISGGAAKMLKLLFGLRQGSNEGLNKKDLADAVGMEASGGSFGTYLSRLRSNGLIQENAGIIYASDTLFI
jgi:hypothetical protein